MGNIKNIFKKIKSNNSYDNVVKDCIACELGLTDKEETSDADGDKDEVRYLNKISPDGIKTRYPLTHGTSVKSSCKCKDNRLGKNKSSALGYWINKMSEYCEESPHADEIGVSELKPMIENAKHIYDLITKPKSDFEDELKKNKTGYYRLCGYDNYQGKYIYECSECGFKCDGTESRCSGCGIKMTAVVEKLSDFEK